jgi:hypothetical protein
MKQESGAPRARRRQTIRHHVRAASCSGCRRNARPSMCIVSTKREVKEFDMSDSETSIDDEQIEQALHEKPVLEKARRTLSAVYEIVSCRGTLNEKVPEDMRLTPAIFWEYLFLFDEDHAVDAELVDYAIKTLQEIRREMPQIADDATSRT